MLSERSQNEKDKYYKVLRIHIWNPKKKKKKSDS